MKKGLIIFFIGLVIILCVTFFAKLSTPDTRSQSEVIHLEVQEMISQKDSLFLMADSVSKMAEEIKMENDSLKSSNPKEVIRLIERVIKQEPVVEVQDEYEVLKSEPMRRDFELEKLQEELERKEHIIRLKDREIESLKLELDSLKK
jgi:hypothetical protein